LSISPTKVNVYGISDILENFFNKIIDLEIDPNATVQQQKIVYLSDDSSIKMILMVCRAISLYEKFANGHRR
jgi:hypothetical protein